MDRIFYHLTALHVIIIIAAQFGDWAYYFDSGNIYHRGGAYIVTNAVHILFLIIDVYLLISCRHVFSKYTKTAAWLYILAPSVAIALQLFNNRIQFIIFATVVAAINLFATIMKSLTEQYEAQKVESATIKAELDMASGIQSNMLPHLFPAIPDREEFDIYASMKSAKEIGGDFYDFFLIDDDNLGIVMADVSGKGVPAALIMMASKIMVENYTIVTKDPIIAIEDVNNQICKNNPEDMFVTVWLGILNIKNRKAQRAVNPGHEYPAIKTPGGDFELYKDVHGFVVGGMEDMIYKKYELDLKPGSKLFLYTDGVAEAANTEEGLYGTDRMLSALRKVQDGFPEELLRTVDESVNDFVKDSPQFDDLTMLCVHYKGAAADKD